MKTLIFIHLLLLPVFLYGQETISIEECLSAAIQNHPRSGDLEMIEFMAENKMKSTDAEWKPRLDLKGQFSYQSEAIEIDIDLPIPDVSFPSAPKDQYKLYLDIQQTLYDGGRIKQKKQMEEINKLSSLKELESHLEIVKSEVIDLYFNILQLQEHIKIQNLMLEILVENKKIIQSGIKNGVMMESDLNLLEIEILNLEQNKRSVELKKANLEEILSQKCGFTLDENRVYSYSELDISGTAISRKELELFTIKKDLLAASANILDKNRMPLVFAFGQFGYGNPGLNMLKDEFSGYYYVGAGLKWNIWDWRNSGREKQNLHYQSVLIDNQQKEFEDQINQALLNYLSEIRIHEEAIKNLRVILGKREEIEKIYESRLEEGIVKTNDYLEMVNQVKITRLQLLSEEIAWQKSIATYNYFKGEI